MIKLYELGINEETINNMLELFPEIREISEEELNKKIVILEKLGCSRNQIINIIGSNPEYLTKSNKIVLELINRLIDLGFRNLNTLFDSNPFVLNFEKFEVDNYINKRKNNGESLEDIVDDLDSNPYLFSEV
jgi:hypothetical protein